MMFENAATHARSSYNIACSIRMEEDFEEAYADELEMLEGGGGMVPIRSLPVPPLTAACWILQSSTTLEHPHDDL